MIFFIVLSYFFNKELKKLGNDLYTFKYSYIFDNMLNAIILSLFFLLLIFFGVIVRINNFGNYYDLYFAYISFIFYIMNTSFFVILFDFCFLISFFFFLIIFVNGFKKILFIQCLKKHLKLISKEKDLLKPKKYLKFVKNYMMIILFIKSIPFFIIGPFIKNEKLKEKIKFFIICNIAYINIFLIFSFIFFDIVFNDLYIKNVIYILPIIFINYLFFGLSNFYNTMDGIDIVISSLYYSGIKKIVAEEYENFVVFNNNFKCSLTIYMLSLQLMSNDFKYDPSMSIPNMSVSK
jgi:hypothetical protein